MGMRLLVVVAALERVPRQSGLQLEKISPEREKECISTLGLGVWGGRERGREEVRE